MRKKIIIYSFISLFLFSSAWNAYFSIITFIASNLSIRESFYFTNDVNEKGTHWGGDNYRLTTRKHKLELVKFKFLDILNSFSKVSNIDPNNSYFKSEYQLIKLLYDIEKNSNSYKRETAIYIPKTLDTYWNLSCDSHMPPFVAPGISNMAMIEGLPMRDSSCYTHFLDYGYYTYILRGKTAEHLDMTREEICARAKQEGFLRVIEIRENSMGDIISLTHECITHIDSI